jgi:hypothetical protein
MRFALVLLVGQYSVYSFYTGTRICVPEASGLLTVFVDLYRETKTGGKRLNPRILLDFGAGVGRDRAGGASRHLKRSKRHS